MPDGDDTDDFDDRAAASARRPAINEPMAPAPTMEIRTVFFLVHGPANAAHEFRGAAGTGVTGGDEPRGSRAFRVSCALLSHDRGSVAGRQHFLRPVVASPYIVGADPMDDHEVLDGPLPLNCLLADAVRRCRPCKRHRRSFAAPRPIAIAPCAILLAKHSHPLVISAAAPAAKRSDLLRRTAV